MTIQIIDPLAAQRALIEDYRGQKARQLEEESPHAGSLFRALWQEYQDGILCLSLDNAKKPLDFLAGRASELHKEFERRWAAR
jgi:hypothetical protein